MAGVNSLILKYVRIDEDKKVSDIFSATDNYCQFVTD